MQTIKPEVIVFNSSLFCVSTSCENCEEIPQKVLLFVYDFRVSQTQKAHENTVSKALLMLVLTQNAFSSHRKYSHPVAWLGGAPGAFTKASLLQNAQWYTGLLRLSETSEKHEQNKLLHSGTCHALFARQDLYLQPRILRSLIHLSPLPGKEEPHIWRKFK